MVDTEVVTPINGDGSYSTPHGFTLPTTGTVTGAYQWDVRYSGDTENLPTSDNNDPDGQVQVNPASPTIVSTASPAITLSTTAPTLSDSAVLAGGYYETGSVVFTLTGPGGFTYSQSDPLNGNRTYTAATALPTAGTVAGTYTWHVSYPGDGNNNAAVDESGAAEQTVVAKASPTLVTTASPAITLGTTAPTLSDSAVLAGGYYETGSVVFTLTGPGGFSYTQSDPLSGNGRLLCEQDAADDGAPVAGTYSWHVSYLGDANNNGANDQGGAAEQTVVSKANPTIMSTASPAITLGTTAPDLERHGGSGGRLFRDRQRRVHADRSGRFLVHAKRPAQRQRHLHRGQDAADHGHGGGHVHLAGQLCG